MAIRKVVKYGVLSWQYDIREPSGKRIRVHGFPTKKDAEDALASIRLRRLQEQHFLPVAFEPVLARAAMREEAAMMRAKAVDFSTRHYPFYAGLVERFGDMLPADLQMQNFTGRHVELFMQRELQRGVRPQTFNTYMRYTKGALNRIKERYPQQLSQWSPPRVMLCKEDNAGRSRLITQEEIQKLIECLTHPPRTLKVPVSSLLHWRDAADVLRIALLTGMRKSEILSLPLASVHSQWSVIKVKTLKRTGANQQVRDILITEPLRAILAARVADNLTGDGLLFPYYRRDMQGHWIRRPLIKACELTGITYGNRLIGGIVLHDSRHTFISKLMHSGADMATIRELSGHTSEAMLMRYAHGTTESKLRALEMAAQLVQEPASVGNEFPVQPTSSVRENRDNGETRDESEPSKNVVK
jgi:integrase